MAIGKVDATVPTASRRLRRRSENRRPPLVDDVIARNRAILNRAASNNCRPLHRNIHGTHMKTPSLTSAFVNLIWPLLMLSFGPTLAFPLPVAGSTLFQPSALVPNGCVGTGRLLLPPRLSRALLRACRTPIRIPWRKSLKRINASGKHGTFPSLPADGLSEFSLPRSSGCRNAARGTRP